MTGTLDYGTASCCDIPCPAAGKTGTTEEQSDAWFVGYTPQVSTAVWTGNPDARIPLPGYGADLSAPIWHDYMLVAASEPCEDFPTPENPADLSGFFSDQTVSGGYDSDTATDTTTDTADATDTDATQRPMTHPPPTTSTPTCTRPGPVRSRHRRLIHPTTPAAAERRRRAVPAAAPARAASPPSSAGAVLSAVGEQSQQCPSST